MKEQYSVDLINFIQESPSPYHAIDSIKKKLHEQGFVELREHMTWEIKPKGKYYVTRNDSSIIAFDLGEDDLNYSFNIVASHSDAPTLKVKPNYELVKENSYVQINVEPYGGAILNTWLDRPLTLAGRVIVKEGNRFVTKLCHLKDDILVIPNLAIHMNREVNQGAKLNPQNHLLPILMQGTEEQVLEKRIAKQLKLAEETICRFDLSLVPAESGFLWGAQKEFISSYHLDDLQCAYTSLVAFLNSHSKKSINVYVCFDNEEVGSTTKQGAASPFLIDTLAKIVESLDSKKSLPEMLSSSVLVSADNAHAAHPNYPEKNDPLNKTVINQGIVVKYNANQRYTTDALSASLFEHYCTKAGVATQNYTNRNDIVGGSTLGNISSHHVAIMSVDIGLPQFAMHSTLETAGTGDTEDMIKALTEFYNSHIMKNEQGEIEVV